MHLSCGTDDELVVEGNREFVAAARQAGVRLTEHFRPGEHEWGFWDAEIQTVLKWLPGLSC